MITAGRRQSMLTRNKVWKTLPVMIGSHPEPSSKVPRPLPRTMQVMTTL